MTPLALAAVVAVPTLAVLAVLGWWLARRRVRPEQNAHTECSPQFSQRGFKRFDPIDGRYGGSIEVYESSAASAPCMWVGIVPPTAGIGPVVHLHLDDATRLRDQLTYLIEHHYQLEQP